VKRWFIPPAPPPPLILLPPSSPKPWPQYSDIGCHLSDRLNVFLFLQDRYLAGVWESTKVLIQNLVEINRERRQLALTLGLHRDQIQVESLESLGEELRIQRMSLNPISKPEIIEMLGHAPAWVDSAPLFCFFSGAATTAIQADAWFGLVDRFSDPLLPLRPYGAVVYDLLQKYLPQSFDPQFLVNYELGMKPTARAARILVVTTPQTRNDLISEYGLNGETVRLFPMAAEPDRRFKGLAAEPVKVPHRSFILNVANSASHKGAAVLLRAYAKLKQESCPNLPPLILCGPFTDQFSSRFQAGGGLAHPHFPFIRNLVSSLVLQEGVDVEFLGCVSEAQLKYLYEHCSLVVNAGKFDNGSYSLVEATYFGKPTLSTRYPAAEYICERFDACTKFFPPDDHEALALLIREALLENVPSLSSDELAQIRARLANPELGARRYAERVYDCLVELAEQGRRDRQMQGAASKVA
jgi:glycosyltransferase involved in cell wall biosynthesis